MLTGSRTTTATGGCALVMAISLCGYVKVTCRPRLAVSPTATARATANLLEKPGLFDPRWLGMTLHICIVISIIGCFRMAAPFSVAASFPHGARHRAWACSAGRANLRGDGIDRCVSGDSRRRSSGLQTTTSSSPKVARRGGWLVSVTQRPQALSTGSRPFCPELW